MYDKTFGLRKLKLKAWKPKQNGQYLMPPLLAGPPKKTQKAIPSAH